jgi:hypothetical protein
MLLLSINSGLDLCGHFLNQRYDSPYISRGTLATACASRNCGMHVQLVSDLFFFSAVVVFGARFLQMYSFEIRPYRD